MTQLILLLCGVLGVIGHCIIKANSLKTDATKANLPWDFSDYLKNDYLGISLSFVAVLMWLLLFEEASTNYPKLQNWMRGSFILVGLAGSYLIQTAFSKAKKIIRTKVDNATNELDKIKEDENR